MAEYSRMDIGLDTVPYNGGTTSCDALWMGVPVVSLPGGRFSSRMGSSVLSTVGLEEFVATDTEDYVQIATRLAANQDRIRSLRSSLRNQVASSPLCNPAEFTRDFETSLQNMLRQFRTRVSE